MDLKELLGDEAPSLLAHECRTISRDRLQPPGPDFVDRVVAASDRSPAVLRNLQHVFGAGRLGGTGYLSILPVDQGVEHSAAASFALNPAYFDPVNLCELAVEAGCNAIASTVGVLGMTSRRYAHRIPFIAKLNHNQLLTYPNSYDQVMFASAGGGDLAKAIRTAVINKRAGGMGLIVGRKAFQRPRDEGVALIQAIQDVYLDATVTIA